MYERQTIQGGILVVILSGIFLIGLLADRPLSSPTSNLPSRLSKATNRSTTLPTVVEPERVAARYATPALVVIESPSSPTNLSATGESESIRTLAIPPAPGCTVILEWDASPDPDVTGYAIYYGTNRTNLNIRAEVGNRLRATVIGLLEDTDYWFACVGYDMTGLESPFSNIIQVKTFIKTFQRFDRIAIESAGMRNRTNYIQMSSNLISWTTVMTFVGNGNLQTYHHTNNLKQAWFRTYSP